MRKSVETINLIDDESDEENKIKNFERYSIATDESFIIKMYIIDLMFHFYFLFFDSIRSPSKRNHVSSSQEIKKSIRDRSLSKDLIHSKSDRSKKEKEREKERERDKDYEKSREKDKERQRKIKHLEDEKRREIRRKEEEIKKREDDLRRRELRRRDEEIKEIEEEAKRRTEEVRRREEQIRQREDQLRRRRERIKSPICKN